MGKVLCISFCKTTGLLFYGCSILGFISKLSRQSVPTKGCFFSAFTYMLMVRPGKHWAYIYYVTMWVRVLVMVFFI